MTPKEKADRLIVKMMSVNIGADRIPKISFEDAKQCALIAVNEIINSHLLSDKILNIHPVDYWQEVKQEIEKL